MKKQVILTLIVILASLPAYPQVKLSLWSEDFEGNWMNEWYSDFGIWQVGTPTIGPNAAHGGNNCVTVGLNSFYPAGTDSRFIKMDLFTIPDASQNPRLRFWHWWSTAGDDGSFVQIKENGSSDWISISPNYVGTGGNIWNYAYIDLTPYAGKTVQLAFYFQSTPYYEGPGWYIDDISVETGQINFSFPEGFEAGMGDWYNDLGSWQVGTPSIGPGGAHEGANCAAIGFNNHYLAGIGTRLISPSFTIPDPSLNPRLRFWHWWSIAGDDAGIVQLKENDSSNWVSISPNYTGTGGNIWNNAFIDLKPYAGKTVQNAFYFQSTPYYEDQGWYIDDVSIETGQNNFTFPEGFEDGMGEWYNDFGSWQVGTPSFGPGGAHEGANCAAIGFNDYYMAGIDTRLISPSFTIPDASLDPRLRFWHWWSIAGDDYGIVQIKENDSSDWISISPNYTGTGGSMWNYAFIDLTPHAGKTVQLAFYFHSTPYYEDQGWYIDDINLEDNQVGISFLEGNKAGKRNLNIYPNPTGDIINIEFDNPLNKNYSLILYSYSGEQVFERKDITSDRVSILKGTLPPGPYVIKLIGNETLSGAIMIK